MIETLKNSFIDLTQAATDKASTLYNIKEKSLIRAAEKTIYMGVCRSDTFDYQPIEKFYKKLDDAFDPDGSTNFYLNPNFIYFFQGGILTNIHPTFLSWKPAILTVWKENKTTWDVISPADRAAFVDRKVEDFYLENDLSLVDVEETRPELFNYESAEDY